MQLILNNDNLVVGIDEQDDIKGGSVTVNGKTYDDVKVLSYDGELPDDIIIPERYIWTAEGIEPNPGYSGDDLATRLNDIEQILIDLLDTI